MIRVNIFISFAVKKKTIAVDKKVDKYCVKNLFQLDLTLLLQQVSVSYFVDYVDLTSYSFLNFQCYSAEELLKIYHVQEGENINRDKLQEIEAALVQQIESKACAKAEEAHKDQGKGYEDWQRKCKQKEQKHLLKGVLQQAAALKLILHKTLS